MAVMEICIDTRSVQFLANRQHCQALLDTLRTRQAQAVNGGRDAQIGRHRELGKLLVRERIVLGAQAMGEAQRGLARCVRQGLRQGSLDGQGLLRRAGE